MKLTKRIKLRHQLGRPAGRWVPTGYYKNRPRLLDTEVVGRIDGFRFIVSPPHEDFIAAWQRDADLYAGRST